MHAENVVEIVKNYQMTLKIYTSINIKQIDVIRDDDDQISEWKVLIECKSDSKMTQKTLYIDDKTKEIYKIDIVK